MIKKGSFEEIEKIFESHPVNEAEGSKRFYHLPFQVIRKILTEFTIIEAKINPDSMMFYGIFKRDRFRKIFHFFPNIQVNKKGLKEVKIRSTLEKLPLGTKLIDVFNGYNYENPSRYCNIIYVPPKFELSRFKNIETIRNFSVSTYSSLTNLKNLKTLSLMVKSLDGALLTAISTMKTLEVLELLGFPYFPTQKTLEFLKEIEPLDMPKLRRFGFKGNRSYREKFQIMNERFFKVIFSKNQQIVDVYFSSCEVSKYLQNFPISMKKIFLKNADVNVGKLLTFFPSLQDVFLRDCYIEKESDVIEYIGGLKKFKLLNRFNRESYYAEDKTSDNLIISLIKKNIKFDIYTQKRSVSYDPESTQMQIESNHSSMDDKLLDVLFSKRITKLSVRTNHYETNIIKKIFSLKNVLIELSLHGDILIEKCPELYNEVFSFPNLTVLNINNTIKSNQNGRLHDVEKLFNGIVFKKEYSMLKQVSIPTCSKILIDKLQISRISIISSGITLTETNLVIRDAELVDVDLFSIENVDVVRGIEKVYFRNCTVCESSIRFLVNNCPNLNNVNIYMSRIDGLHKLIEGCKNMENLYFHRCAVNHQEELRKVKVHPTLKFVNMSNADISESVELDFVRILDLNNTKVNK